MAIANGIGNSVVFDITTLLGGDSAGIDFQFLDGAKFTFLAGDQFEFLEQV